MSRVLKCTYECETFSIHECSDGFWLYDDIIGMNLSMKAKSEQNALIEALLYHQKKLVEARAGYNALKDKVDSFLCQLNEQED